MSDLTEKEKQSGRQYLKEFWPSMVGYVVILLGAQALLTKYPDTMWEIPLALSPVIPVYFVIRAIVRFIGRMDEFQKKIFMETAVITLLAVTLSAFAYGFLEGQGFPPVNLLVAASMVLPLYFLIYFIVKRKY